MSNFILLPETKEHPDILVAKHRLALDSKVREIATAFGFKLNNTAKELRGNNPYIGYITYSQAQRINIALLGFTLPVLYFNEHLDLLYEGANGNTPAYDENGKRLPRVESEDLLKEMVEQRDPWRGETLDAKFGNGTITYYRFVGGELVEVTEPLDEDTLMEDRRISFGYWLKNPTSQGLVRRDTPEGDIYSWYPKKDNSVAWFDADSDGVDFDFCWNLHDSNSAFGVRLARKKI